MQIEIGAVYEGTVTGLTNFGAFVKLENGTTGMVHISEVANEYVSDISQHLSEGDTVKVKVIDINEKGKVSLSIKKALPPEPKQEKPKAKPRNNRNNNANKGWKGLPKEENNGPMSFEDMMAKFKAQSEDKMSDLKKNSDKKGGGGYRRSKGQQN